jgi:hypothetical protein
LKAVREVEEKCVSVYPPTLRARAQKREIDKGITQSAAT